MALQYPNIVNCGGRVTGTSGAVLNNGAGFTCVRNGAGDYSLTLQQPVDANECWAAACIMGATSGQIRIVDTSDSVKQVLTFAADGTTASDRNFSFTLFNAPG